MSRRFIDARLLEDAGRRYLTKSLFQKACECPRKLAYALSKDFKAKDTGRFLQNLADDGKKIGAYSRLLFPDGVEVEGAFTEELLVQTKSLLDSNDSVTLFEGAFRAGPCLIRADILRKTAPNELHLMEVKAKAWDSREEFQIVGKRGGIKPAFLPYIRDVAFQKLVIQHAFPDYNITASLVMPDKAKVNTTIPNLNGLFPVSDDSNVNVEESSRKKVLGSNEMLMTEVNVDELVEAVRSSELSVPGTNGETFEEAVSLWGPLVEKDILFESIRPPIGIHCRDCEFRTAAKAKSGFATCWGADVTGLVPQSEDDLVIDIHYGGKSAETLISAGKYLMSDVEPNDLKLTVDGVDEKKKGPGMSQREKQWYQVQNKDSVVLDKDYLRNEIETWQYPYHFIDFETISPALPFTVNKRPFQMLAFQFSHHKMDKHGHVEHSSEFLHAIPGECPNRPFLEALQESLNSGEGTVFRWGAHENTVLSKLLESEQDALSGREGLEALLSGGENAMVDLMRLCEKGYYAPGSGASSSLKKLLLPTLKLSQTSRDMFGQPTYNSRNFTDMQWWKEEDGTLCDPYSLLAVFDDDSSIVSQGGDAIVSYNILQNSLLDPTTRAQTEASLLRYCELDTLAMAMVVQGLFDLLEE